MDAFHTFLLAHSATPGEASPAQSAQPTPLSRTTARWHAQWQAARRHPEDEAAFTALLDRLELMAQRMREAPDPDEAPEEDAPPPQDEYETPLPPPGFFHTPPRRPRIPGPNATAADAWLIHLEEGRLGPRARIPDDPTIAPRARLPIG